MQTSSVRNVSFGVFLSKIVFIIYVISYVSFSFNFKERI
jgi:hypothetical protein